MDQDVNTDDFLVMKLLTDSKKGRYHVLDDWDTTIVYE